MTIANPQGSEMLPWATHWSADAYEVYWSLTEAASHARSAGRPSAPLDALQLCTPGDAYNEWWQLWDGR